MNAIRTILKSSSHAILTLSPESRMLALLMLSVGMSGAIRATAADDYYDIGDFHCKVTTGSKDAQTWFDRGLAMCHAFNHGEAVRCFEQAHPLLYLSPGRFSCRARHSVRTA